MTEKAQGVEPVNFPSEGRLVHAAMFITSGKFYDEMEEQIQEALDVFNLEKKARALQPIKAQERIIKFDASSQIYNAKRIKAHNRKDEQGAYRFDVKKNCYLFAKVPDNAIALLKAELESRKPNPAFDDKAFDDLPPANLPNIDSDPKPGTYPKREE